MQPTRRGGMPRRTEEKEALMMPRSQDLASLQSHIRHLRCAVATTSCGATVDALQRMLSEAESRIQQRDMGLSASSSKRL